ncbi:MAG: NAD(+)/NADH kinase [Rikenellaceae bacterium]
MKIAIYTKGGKYLTDEEMVLWGVLMTRYGVSCSVNSNGDATFLQRAVSLGFEVYNNVSELSEDTSFLISYGGDGTFLHSIEMLRELSIPILGINSGRLGFLASVPREETEMAIKALLSGDYTIEKRPLMEITSKGETFYAFNEFTLQKSTLSMINVQLLIGGEYVANYMADGLIVSTPSGSTGYSMSVGGAIIAPDCNCFIINPIAPHNLNMRPIIISDHSILELSAVSREKGLLATMDNRWSEIENGVTFTVKKSSYNIALVKLRNTSFYKTIREKLMWGMDAREIK